MDDAAHPPPAATAAGATTGPAAVAHPSGDAGVFTLPNIITLARLACLPLFLWLLFGRENRAAAAWLLAALGITDWVDGYLARHLHQESELGKVLDPVADRLLFFVGAGGILVDGSVPVWFAVVVLVRETLVGGTTLVLAALGARRIDVTWFGKAGTFFLMIAFPLFLASNSTLGWADTAEVLAWLAGIPGLALSLYAAALYVPLARRALREGRADRLVADPAG
ncbi:MAG: CDP-alcohol phosphatidyltransferase family protein [Acidimicrobiales bacterium]|jgi:cardiolipin synthase